MFDRTVIVAVYSLPLRQINPAVVVEVARGDGAASRTGGEGDGGGKRAVTTAVEHLERTGAAIRGDDIERAVTVEVDGDDSAGGAAARRVDARRHAGAAVQDNRHVAGARRCRRDVGPPVSIEIAGGDDVLLLRPVQGPRREQMVMRVLGRGLQHHREAAAGRCRDDQIRQSVDVEVGHGDALRVVADR